MICKGGYNVLLKGEPSKEIKDLPIPDALYLPLFSLRLNFSELCVQDGEEVKQGQVLAKDPANYSVPLIAPRAGTVKIDMERRLATLENIQQVSKETIDIESDLPDVAKNMGPEGKNRYALVRLGAWQFFSDACTGDLPDPYGTPQAIIITTSHLEPFLASTEALLTNRVSNFKRGLENIHSILKNQPVYLVIPKNKSNRSTLVKDSINKFPWVKCIEVPSRYPFDNVKLLARLLELDKTPEKGSIWACGIEGVLAADLAITESKPCVTRVISIAGPGAKTAEHIGIIIGYPIVILMESYQNGSPTRMINGGVFTGHTIGKDQDGLDIECQGLTLLPEHDKREVLAFAHLGFTKHAYSNTFLSALRPAFRERYTTGIRAEQRPCISCGFCEDVCPSKLMPHLIRQYVDKNRLEEAERFGLNLCVQCGLCSQVCTSKIEIKQKLLEAQEKLKQELQSEQEHS